MRVQRIVLCCHAHPDSLTLYADHLKLQALQVDLLLRCIGLLPHIDPPSFSDFYLILHKP